ncbi:MAG: hypothetical protein ACM3X3_07085 [Betaproteobacteria bacterium]
MGRYLEIARQVSRREEGTEVPQNDRRAREREESPPRAPVLEARPATPSLPAGCTVRFVGPSPVILGPHGEDPIDFRFDVDKQAWVHDPGWWREKQR